jgi:hypothetical protein
VSEGKEWDRPKSSRVSVADPVTRALEVAGTGAHRVGLEVSVCSEWRESREDSSPTVSSIARPSVAVGGEILVAVGVEAEAHALV